MTEYSCATRAAGDEISGVNLGRTLTVVESELVHPSHIDGLVDAGDPVIHGNNIVGVALSSASAATDLIAVETEGIWAMQVVGSNEEGPIAVSYGDRIYIDKDSGVLSKNYNKNTHLMFGYALGPADAGSGGLVAIKVHWSPNGELDLVGTSAFPADIGTLAIAREYRYRSTAVSGDVRGQYVQLSLNGVGSSGEASRNRTVVEAAGVLSAHGGHSGIEFDDDGTVTGLAVGHRSTFKAPDRDAFATIAGGMSELWADGASTNFGASTMHSIHRFVMDGDATGKETAENVFEFVGLSSTQYAANTDTPDHALRVVINGDVRYIMVSEAQS